MSDFSYHILFWTFHNGQYCLFEKLGAPAGNVFAYLYERQARTPNENFGGNQRFVFGT
jgi:hypothetical protein